MANINILEIWSPNKGTLSIVPHYNDIHPIILDIININMFLTIKCNNFHLLIIPHDYDNAQTKIVLLV